MAELHPTYPQRPRRCFSYHALIVLCACPPASVLYSTSQHYPSPITPAEVFVTSFLLLLSSFRPTYFERPIRRRLEIKEKGIPGTQPCRKSDTTQDTVSTLSCSTSYTNSTICFETTAVQPYLRPSPAHKVNDLQNSSLPFLSDEITEQSRVSDKIFFLQSLLFLAPCR